MNNPFNTRAPRTDGKNDSGSILSMTLIMVVVSSLLVVALLAFIQTVLRVRPPIEERAVASETARSAIRQAVHQQRVDGPDGCYDNNQVIEINGLDAEVRCYVTDIQYDNVLNRNRFGVITTSNNQSVPAISGSSSAAAAVKQLAGDVFVNAGPTTALTTDIEITGDSSDGSPAGITGSDFVYPTLDPLLGRYDVATLPVDCTAAGVNYSLTGTAGWDCIADAWAERAGYNPDPATSPWSYPFVPPIPSIERGSTPLPLQRNGSAGDTCHVFYPGSYSAPLDLANGDFYFTSGIYYFEHPVVIRNGARVVAGEGTASGCILDSEAALYDVTTAGVRVRAPKVHGITGNGATFLLGGDAEIDVRGASLLMNRRLSTETTRATEGVSIQSVNTAEIANANVYVPEDRVFSQAGEPIVDASTTSYTASAAAWDHPIVRFDATTGGAAATASDPFEFSILGAIFVPNAAIQVTTDNPYYTLEVTGGTTSTLLGLDITELPSNPADYFLGSKRTAVQTEFRFDALVTSPSGRRTVSSSVMQLNISQEYALNSWTLDIGTVGADPTNGGAGIGGTSGGSGGGGGTGGGTSGGSTSGGGTTDGAATDGATTDGATTDGATTDGAATDGATTDGATTDGGTTPVDPCLATPNWDGQYFDNDTLAGVATGASADADLSYDWGTGSPTGVSDDFFSARFTRKVVVPETDTYLFTIASDNGSRLYVNDVLVHDHWTATAPQIFEVQAELTAGCANDLRLEFFESTGGASVSLDYEVFVPDPCLADTNWTGQYWDNRDLSGTPDLVREETEIDFNWNNNSAPVGSDYNDFSARWTKKILVPEDGDYRFTVGGDDGYRMKVADGPWIINEWNDQGYNTESVDVPLTAGCSVLITMEFYERGGYARATLDYEPVPEIQTCTNTHDDFWYVRFYNSTNFNDYRGWTEWSSINSNWRSSSPWYNQLGNDTFSIRYAQTFNFPGPGTYRFTGGGDDGIRLFMNGDNVLDDWGNHAYRTTQVDVEITDHCDVELVFEYYEAYGGARNSFEWEYLG